jgi:anti-sigma-K factor RskA
MDLHRHAGLVERLAAEYALGVLRGAPRRRLESLARHDPAIRQSIETWRHQLASMAELGAVAAPPPEVWLAIERRLDLVNARRVAGATVTVAPPARTAPRSMPDWFNSLSFWRGWSIAATALAALALVVAIRYLVPAAPVPQLAQVPEVSYVATLSDKDARPLMLVTWNEKTSDMTVRRLSGAADPADKSMQLWGLPKQGHPVSLGVLPQGATASMKVAALGGFPALAISVEPIGGSPDPNGPTGPVVYTGKVVPTA